MEITLLPKQSLKIKGKHALLLVNSDEKLTGFNAALLLQSQDVNSETVTDECVVISGPGEYEIAGVKITGIRNMSDVVYTLNIDEVDILIGNIEAIEKLQHKLKENHIVIIHADKVLDASFITSISSNCVLFFGDKSDTVGTNFAKEALKKMPKYTTTKDKLPQEMETVLLASSS